MQAPRVKPRGCARGNAVRGRLLPVGLPPLGGESSPSPFAPSRLPASRDGPALSGAGAKIREALLQPRISLFWGAQAPTRSLLTAATTIAAGGLPVRLFDGGNSFDGYFVARLARQLALASARPPAHRAAHPGEEPDRLPPPPARADPYDILDRMHLSRA